MRCLKCGRETEQTFCEKCRAEMEKYPIKPGTIVLLPKERTSNKKPQVWHPPLEPEEVVENQRRTIRRLSRAFAALLVLTVLMGIAIVRLVQDSGQRPVGQNYSTVTKPSEETTAAAETQATDTQAEDEVIAPAELEDYIFSQEESEEESLYQAAHTGPVTEPTE